MATTLDPDLERQVRDALAHLYDYAYLQRHPLAERLLPPQAAVTRTRAQELRRILLDAVEALNPGDNVPLRAPERRPYAILFGLYVEGRPLPEIAGQLGIGGRQLRRDRADAIAALASLLYDRYTPSSSPVGGRPLAPEPLRLESERMAMAREWVDPAELVAGLLPLLAGLARERGVELASHAAMALPPLRTNRTLLRQALILLASQALTTLPLARLTLDALPAHPVIGLGLLMDYRTGVELPGTEARLALDAHPAETVVTALGASLLQEVPQPGQEAAWVLLPLRDELSVLVVDDNEELFALFQRYVAGLAYHLIHAAGADEALQLARERDIAAITLDLMLPGRDGWELLQALRADPATAQIPVIVCSVLEEPALARTLGAQLCLKKPVGQAELLAALQAATMQVWARGGHRAGPARS